jgi:hypothetical protein
VIVAQEAADVESVSDALKRNVILACAIRPLAYGCDLATPYARRPDGQLGMKATNGVTGDLLGAVPPLARIWALILALYRLVSYHLRIGYNGGPVTTVSVDGAGSKWTNTLRHNP